MRRKKHSRRVIRIDKPHLIDVECSDLWVNTVQILTTVRVLKPHGYTAFTIQTPNSYYLLGDGLTFFSRAVTRSLSSMTRVASRLNMGSSPSIEGASRAALGVTCEEGGIVGLGRIPAPACLDI
jgi:hypothetical protein